MIVEKIKTKKLAHAPAVSSHRAHARSTRVPSPQAVPENALLSVTGLHKRFGGLHAVNDAHLRIHAGQITALVGPNGAGKTTLFDLVTGLQSPDAGKIMFRHHALVGLEPFEIARLGIARTFQLTRLFKNLSVRDNLLLALQTNDQDLVHSFVKSTQPSDAALHPALHTVGLAKPLDQPAGNLSYGQKKLLELARCLLQPHELILLDEPVAGVNPALRLQIADTLKRLRAEGQTILLIEHDMDFVMNLADSVVVMHKGQVIANGPPDIVRKNPVVLEAYLGAHA